MKKNILMAVWIALVVLGCSTLQQNEAQYQVLGPKDDRGIVKPVSAADREAVKQIVNSFGTQWRLQDRTSISFIPTVLASYSQDWNPHPVNLVAYSYENRIIVDLSQSTSGVGESTQFRSRKEQLLAALREKFGSRAILPKLMDYVRHVQVQVPQPAEKQP